MYMYMYVTMYMYIHIYDNYLESTKYPNYGCFLQLRQNVHVLIDTKEGIIVFANYICIYNKGGKGREMKGILVLVSVCV